MDQDYSEEDDKRHIQWLLKAFHDKRYIRVAGKPLFLVYRANQLPNSLTTTQIWREEAKRSGLEDLYLCRVESFPDEHSDPMEKGFDAAIEFQPDWQEIGPQLTASTYGNHSVFKYDSVVQRMLAKQETQYKRFPCVTPGWDNSPRRKSEAHIFIDSKPELYENWLGSVIRGFKTYGPGENLVFINAWNEWGEGNYLEPDAEFGRAYLQSTKRAVMNNAKRLPIQDQRSKELYGLRESHSRLSCQIKDLKPNEYSVETLPTPQTNFEKNRSAQDKLPGTSFSNLQRKRIIELEKNLQDIYDSRGWKLLKQYYRLRDSVLWRKKRLLSGLRRSWISSREK